MLALVSPLVLAAQGDPSPPSVPAPWNPSPPAPLGETGLVDFEPGSIIIPMDGCYQRPSFVDTAQLSTIIGGDPAGAACNGTNQADQGLIPAYSLVFRLVAAGIPVHWSIRHNKTSWNDIDVSLVRAGGGPVTWMSQTGTSENRYAGITQTSYRGAPFIIAAADAAAAKSLIAGMSQCALGSCYDEVDFHVAQVPFQAPIYKTISALPKLAVVDVDDPATGLQNPQTSELMASLEEALMADLNGTLYERITIAEVLSGRLQNEAFTLAWLPPFALPGAPTPRQQQFLDQLTAFADGGGHVLAQDAAIAALEGYGSWSSSYVPVTAPTAALQASDGLLINGTDDTWDRGSGDERTVSDDFSDPAAQFGGLFWTGIGGSTFNWRPRDDRSYLPGVRRMIFTDHQSNSSQDDWDFATWRHKDNDPSKGIVYYVGGSPWRKDSAAGLRVLLNTVLVSAPIDDGPDADVAEASRSAPVLAVIAGETAQLQGSFEVAAMAAAAPTYSGSADDDTFVFPHVAGHLRAVSTATLADGATDLKAAPLLFNAADGIPVAAPDGCAPGFDGGCRTVFTTVASGARPARVAVATSSRDALGPLLGAALSPDEIDTLIARVLAGRQDGGAYVATLGGIDRSTMAVVEASPMLGGERPTMIYVGALDGMLHAICAEAGGPCPAAGVELWAYVPRTQLPLLRLNEQRLDGSPRVTDVFGDFNGTGRREWRTVLTFQTGSGDPANAAAAPGVYALDVSSPANPQVLWEYTAPATRGAIDLGVGIGLAMGPAYGPGGVRQLTVAATNNGGTDPGSGIYVVALDTLTGQRVWDFGQLYPAPRSAGNPVVPDSGIPAGVTGVDLEGAGELTDILVPTLYGDVWMLRAIDGVNRYGSDPLLRLTTDFRPIGAPVSIYVDALSLQPFAVAVTGGYADRNPTTWSPSDVNQYAVAFPLRDVASAPLSEATAAANGGFAIDLGIGQRAFSQAVIVGGELFIVTASEDINVVGYGPSAGRLTRYSLSDGSQLGAAVELQGGAGGLDVDPQAGTVHTASGSLAERQTPTGLDPSGTGAELVFQRSVRRALWLRSQ